MVAFMVHTKRNHLFFTVLAMASLVAGCRMAHARFAIDIATAACIVANSSRADEDVAKICGIVDALDDPMRELLKASREQVAAAQAKGEVAGAVKCLGQDGGK
jgi:uncharacterized protein with PhoU and TrkA domain